MYQFLLGLVLESNIFFLPLTIIYFSNWRLMNLVDSELTETFDLTVYPRRISVIKCNSFMKNEILHF